MSGVPDSSHGGSGVASGALVSLQAPQVAWTGSFGSLAFDTVEKDTAGYWSASQNRFNIPSGLGGLFVVSLFLVLAADALITSALAFVGVSGVGPNCTSPLAKDIVSSNVWQGTASYVIYNAAGDVVAFACDFSGTATVTANAGCFASIARIGSLA